MRACGILMPVFSLPGPLWHWHTGQTKRSRLSISWPAAKQTYWQILPIGPTGYGDSPYQSFSAFRRQPLFH